MKRTNPAVIIISNYSLERCYHKALEKDPTALDSLKTRVTEISLHQPLDIDGLLEALATASVATTATLTTSSVVVEPSAPTSALQEALDLSSSTIDLTPPNSPPMESVTSTLPILHRSTPTSPLSQPLTSNDYTINEDDLIPCQEVTTTREETPYEKFQRERREKIRKQQREEERISAIDRIAIKGKNILYTGYN